MSIFPKFFFTLFGNVPLPSWLRSYIARVEEDGGTIVDTGHTKEVYADVIDYEPTLIQSCDSGKAGTLYSIIPPQGLLLYRYTGAAAAYSLRSLSAGTVYVVKVRRSGDNAELDFTASQVSDGTLAAWVVAGGGTEDGFLTTWYDQSGNTNNATQSTAAGQPKIVSSGTLVTENGKAAVSFDNVDDFMNTSAFTSLSNSSYFIVSQLNIGSGINDYHYVFSTEGAAPIQSLAKWHNDGSADANKRYFYSGATVYYDGVNSLNQELSSLFFPTSSPYLNLYVNGSAQTFSTTPPSAVSISNKYIALGRWDANTANYCDGVIQEFIVYASDQSANRTGIEANINDYYNIYP